MTLAAPSPSGQLDQRVVLRDVSWETYTRLLEELEGQQVSLTFDRGLLEIISPSPKHAKIGKFIARLVETLTLELEIPIVGLGNATWRNEAIARGLEADECYYIQRAGWAAGREEFDLALDPPPDLAIEVDIASSSIDKQAIYAALRVPELWGWERDRLLMLELCESRYEQLNRSISLPMLHPDLIEQFVRRRNSADDTALMLEFRKLVRGGLD